MQLFATISITYQLHEQPDEQVRNILSKTIAASANTTNNSRAAETTQLSNQHNTMALQSLNSKINTHKI